MLSSLPIPGTQAPPHSLLLKTQIFEKWLTNTKNEDQYLPEATGHCNFFANTTHTRANAAFDGDYSHLRIESK